MLGNEFMKRCPQCGRNINDKVKFCPYCGARQSITSYNSNNTISYDNPNLYNLSYISKHRFAFFIFRHFFHHLVFQSLLEIAIFAVVFYPLALHTLALTPDKYSDDVGYFDIFITCLIILLLSNYLENCKFKCMAHEIISRSKRIWYKFVAIMYIPATFILSAFVVGLCEIIIPVALMIALIFGLNAIWPKNAIMLDPWGYPYRYWYWWNN